MHDLIVKMQGSSGGANGLSARAAVLWKQTTPSTWRDSDKAQIVAQVRRQIASWLLRSRIVVLSYLNAAH